MNLNICELERYRQHPSDLYGFKVVHKETIDFTGLIVLIYSELILNIKVMWITDQFCGILFCLNFGDL